MKVSDIAVTYIDGSGTDLSVVNAARVSFDKESDWDMVEIFDDAEGPIPLYIAPRLQDRDVKLINYLAKNKHLSPFNHAFITVQVKAPIFVARQLVKHEYMPWNEVSRRYVDSEPEFHSPSGYREKADNVKQGSGGKLVDELLGKSLQLFYRSSTQSALNTYNLMLEKGVCPEQARMILPQNMMTEWYWSGTLGAFAKMLGLRLDSHTQYETRIVAEKIRNIIEPMFPVSLKALLEHR